MEHITENDRGTFIVTTRSGTTHEWVITDDGITVERNPAPASAGHSDISMWGFVNGRANHVTEVRAWPVVGQCFLYYMSGDIPWTRSSTVVSIEVKA